MPRHVAPPSTPIRNHIGVVRCSAAATSLVVAWTWSHAGLLPALGVLAWLCLLAAFTAALWAVAAAERRRREEWRLIEGRRHIDELLAEGRGR